MDAMTIDEIVEASKKISYKRAGRKLEIFALGDRTIQIAMDFFTEDSTGKHERKVNIGHRQILNPAHQPVGDENHLAYIVWDFIERAEIHETQEFFRVNGKLYNDPHKDDMP